MRSQNRRPALASVSRPSTKLLAMSGTENIIRMIVAIIVLLVVFVTVVAPTRPILANPPLFEIGVAYRYRSAKPGGAPSKFSARKHRKNIALKSGTTRSYGAGGEDVATSSLQSNRMECRDAPAERLEQVPRRPGPK